MRGRAAVSGLRTLQAPQRRSDPCAFSTDPRLRGVFLQFYSFLLMTLYQLAL